MKQFFIVFLIIILASCGQDNFSFEKTKIVTTKNDSNSIKVGNEKRKIRADTVFKKLKCGLYINKKGDIGYRDFDKFQSDEDCCSYFYITSAFVDKERTNKVPLKKIIDTNSAIFLNDLYFKDRRRVFFFFDMMEGGHIVELKNVDAKTFQTFKDTLYRYGFDKNNFFNGDEVLSKKEIKEMNLTRKLAK